MDTIDHTDLLWSDERPFNPYSNEFYAVLLHLNPMLTRKETQDALSKVHTDLETRLRPWIQHYVWDRDPIEVGIHEHEREDYIFLRLRLGETDIDEWLITSILWDLSLTYEDVYIHCWDNEGDHLLVESWEVLPDWLQPETARNRAWINHQRVLIVPEVYYKDRGLKLPEAITFLRKASYKCLRVIEIDQVMKKKCKEFPVKALESQVIMEVQVSRGVAGVLMKNNSCVNPAVIDYLREESVVHKGSKVKEISDPVTIKVPTKVESFLMLKLWLEKEGELDVVKVGGRVVTHAVQEYIKKHDIEQLYTPLNKEVEQFNNRGDVLQKELIRLMRIKDFVKPKLDYEIPEDAMEDAGIQDFDEDAIMKKMEQFFKDNESGLKGVDNMGDKAEEFDGDESDSDDEDDKAREFLKSQNVDIDEDDFFEFFAKEALKLNDEDLDAFRQMKLDDGGEDMDQDDDSDDDDDDQDIPTHDDLQQSLRELLMSLQDAPDGPATTLFKNMK